MLRENEALKKSLRETDTEVLRLTGALERQTLETKQVEHECLRLRNQTQGLKENLEMQKRLG